MKTALPLLLLVGFPFAIPANPPFCSLDDPSDAPVVARDDDTLRQQVERLEKLPHPDTPATKP